LFIGAFACAAPDLLETGKNRAGRVHPAATRGRTTMV
jgi:hypothetical protein